jgi:hypothetical protein
VPRRTIERIREKIRLLEYDMTVHAMEEMAEDNLDILDIEHAILNGQIARIEKSDPRGTKYVVEGSAVDEKIPVGIVGRFTTTGRYLVITVYEVTSSEG